MSSNVDLKEYMPDIYKGVIESETQQDSLSIEVNKLHDRYEQAMMDQFIQFASIKALPYYENIFGIVANPVTESLEFRRQRILSRMRALRPPYTRLYLKRVLDGFFGEGNYILDIDNDSYIIVLQSSASNSLWYHEIRATITSIKPSNMIFENVPLVDTNLLVNEQISSAKTSRNYRLNGTWLLGLKPFASIGQQEIRKMADVPSIQPEFISKSLEYWQTLISKIKINNTITITQLTMTIEEQILNIEYTISSEQASIISNIKILDSENNELSNANVYIPVEDYVLVKHRIKLEEGINE